MAQKIFTQEIKTREFIRNFKMYKDLIKSKSINNLIIPIGDGDKIEVKLLAPDSNGKKIVEFLKNLENPIVFKRNKVLWNDILDRKISDPSNKQYG